MLTGAVAALVAAAVAAVIVGSVFTVAVTAVPCIALGTTAFDNGAADTTVLAPVPEQLFAIRGDAVDAASEDDTAT